MNVSDRRLHVQLTQEAKIASDFSFIRAIFAFVGFVSALSRPACQLPDGCVAGRVFYLVRYSYMIDQRSSSSTYMTISTS